ncbi:RNA polymerase sigma factor [Nocardia sp. NPDC059240]|uniref:RNA polymerase sigma factor n=1 Tax=Nocardia sp. NPDC059240 TaxID=3346786 RepID=UPI0036C8FD24
MRRIQGVATMNRIRPADEIPDATSESDSRAAGDAALFALLLAERFAGPAWELARTEMARYSLGVLRGWLATGHIRAELRAVGRGADLTAAEIHRLAIDDHFRDDLLDATVAVALHDFRRRALLGNGWRPGEAAMTTYLTRRCLYAFLDELRIHRRAQQRHQRTIDAVTRHEAARPESDHYAVHDSVRELTGRDRLRHQLAQLDERDRNIVWGKAAGHTNAEIAEIFGESGPRTVERRWSALMAQHDWIARLGRTPR